jgi:hypothetical protein
MIYQRLSRAFLLVGMIKYCYSKGIEPFWREGEGISECGG